MELQPPLDDRTRWSAIGQCPIEKAMGLVGSRPAMLLLREAHYGTQRFDDFVERVGIAPATAAAHLRALTEAGLLERATYQEPGDRAREGYSLTRAGSDLMPVVIGLFEWGVRYADGNDALEYSHVGCGAPVTVNVACAEGHLLSSDEVAVRVAHD
ncbi:winged helix-turn-helix transcriptional regulator [Nocardioides marmorisolisilvae]|uniref:Transcriptional regulator n=1 Tax=Nocardioides marmorisolisilvae TaxID=1542737 RepID=A0A3N0DJC1_9ACTN|nr:helix-turn-helix domain-containing protein [Nocardioides marmorisolisilvae]RNL75333.1 transcriptional regulator [Nocardioides marmorisolisilvae]